jgi:hypothetical protein
MKPTRFAGNLSLSELKQAITHDLGRCDGYSVLIIGHRY